MTKRRRSRWQHKYNKAVVKAENNYNKGYEAGYKEACSRFMKLFNINFSEQQLNAVGQGLEVTAHNTVEYKTTDLIKILNNN